MKKVVLAATTALVAAGSAAALEVTLGGEISASVGFDTDNAGAGAAWTDPAMGGEVNLVVSGESMGWTYGAELNLLADDLTAASMSIGSAGLGSLSISAAEIVWSGMDIAGFAVTVTGDLSDIEDSSFGLVGSLGGMSVEANIANDAVRTFDAEIGTAVAGSSVLVTLDGNLSNTSSVDYSLAVGMSAMGLDLGVDIDDDGVVGLSATMGALTVEADLSSGDLFGGMTATYSSDLAEGLALEAILGTDGDDTTLDVTATLSF